jgi:hypothetical protein
MKFEYFFTNIKAGKHRRKMGDVSCIIITCYNTNKELQNEIFENICDLFDGRGNVEFAEENDDYFVVYVNNTIKPSERANRERRGGRVRNLFGITSRKFIGVFCFDVCIGTKEAKDVLQYYQVSKSYQFSNGNSGLYVHLPVVKVDEKLC